MVGFDAECLRTIAFTPKIVGLIGFGEKSAASSADPNLGYSPYRLASGPIPPNIVYSHTVLLNARRTAVTRTQVDSPTGLATAHTDGDRLLSPWKLWGNILQARLFNIAARDLIPVSHMRIVAVAYIIIGLGVGGCAPMKPLGEVVAGDMEPGRHVRVEGYISLEFEGRSIYQSRSDCEERNGERGLWLEVSRNLLPDHWERCTLGRVTGVYDPSDTGHFGLWPRGALVGSRGITEVQDNG